MFRARYAQATRFKKVIQAVAKVMDEFPFVATSDGLHVRVLTPDKTTMIILEMPTYIFEDFQLDEEKKSFIVSSDDLNRVAKRGARNDFVELTLDEEGRKLEINFINQKTGVERKFQVPLREGIVEELSEPTVDLTVDVEMSASVMKEIINDAKLVGDEVEFIGYEDRLEVRVEATQKTYRGVFKIGEGLEFYSIKANPPIRAKYSIDLLKSTLRATSAADAVKLGFGEALPMRVNLSLGGGASLIYWVSPRV